MDLDRPTYTVRHLQGREPVAFSTLEEIRLSHWLDTDSGKRPEVGFRLCCTSTALIGRFEVRAERIRCVNTRFQSPVYEDSCVEFFFRPFPDRGYFNFEFNCAGTVLSYFITDWTRAGNAVAAYQPLTEAELRTIAVRSTFGPEDLPIHDILADWSLEFEIPFALLRAYTAEAGEIQKQPEWRGNAYKCADLSASPHWGSWAPLRAKNFHSPEEFGRLLPTLRGA